MAKGISNLEEEWYLNNVNEIYITLYTNHKDLISLLEKNNYTYYYDNTNNEKVYVNKIKEF